MGRDGRLQAVGAIVLASRASGCHLDTLTFKNQTSGHPNSFVKNIIDFSYLNIIPMTLYKVIVPDFKKELQDASHSQQGIWVSFGHPNPLEITPQDTQNSFVKIFLKSHFEENSLIFSPQYNSYDIV